MTYVHTQRSVLLPAIVGLSALVPILIVLAGPRHDSLTGLAWPLVLVVLIVLASAVSFSSLTIGVDDRELLWHFGLGMLRKSIPLAEITRVESATTSTFDGLGIHYTMRGWLYNVAGRRAVLITLRDGRRLMLGTDEPERLVAALRSPS